MNRDAAIEALHAHLAQELDSLERVAAMAVDEATGAESKAENKYDTRGLEASYLARGQAERVVALRRLVGWLGNAPRSAEGRVGLGSLVELEEEERRRWVLLLPDGGGTRTQVAGEQVTALTPDAPLGRALLGAEADDEVELAGRAIEVLSVR